MGSILYGADDGDRGEDVDGDNDDVLDTRLWAMITPTMRMMILTVMAMTTAAEIDAEDDENRYRM